jgi:hypothetical protein
MKRDKKNSHYFMIKNLYKDETRIAMLDKLDDLLKNYDLVLLTSSKISLK